MQANKLIQVGNWRTQQSSSGKTYYYNIASEQSQWEKPPEWVEAERFR